MSKLPAEFLRHILSAPLSVVSRLSAKLPKNLPTDFTIKYPDINWKDMAGMRDRLIHGYFGVDYEIVWDVAKNELPSLKPKIEEIIILATAEE